MKHPDPKKHLQISLVKSALRILAAGLLMMGFIVMAGIGFIFAEMLGIYEELV